MIVPSETIGTIPVLPTIAHTGHRRVESAHIPRLLETFRTVLRNGPERLIVTGGAMGWDTIVAEQALLYPQTCRLLVARPYAGHDSGWPGEWRKRFAETWDRAAIRVTVCPVSDSKIKQTYHIRNAYMLQLAEQAPRLDHASRRPDHSLTAYWDGQERTGSGTWATIKEALKRGIPVSNWYPGQAPRVDPVLLLPNFADGRLFA